MRHLMSGLFVVLACIGQSQALTMTIQDQTDAGNSPLVMDNVLRSDGLADSNLGIIAQDRQYPDVGYPSGKGPRHTQYWFDLSTIPAGSTINSASFGVWFQRNNSGAPEVTGYKLSRFQSGKTWIEGLSDGDYSVMTSAGEPTWNSQKHQQAAWETAGATGAGDIDLATTVLFNKQAAVSEWMVFDLTAWVNDWVNNGVENNGVLIWGGVANAETAYWQPLMSEYTADISQRPYLTVDYVPEPTMIGLLGIGLLGLRRRRGE